MSWNVQTCGVEEGLLELVAEECRRYGWSDPKHIYQLATNCILLVHCWSVCRKHFPECSAGIWDIATNGTWPQPWTHPPCLTSKFQYSSLVPRSGLVSHSSLNSSISIETSTAAEALSSPGSCNGIQGPKRSQRGLEHPGIPSGNLT